MLICTLLFGNIKTGFLQTWFTLCVPAINNYTRPKALVARGKTRHLVEDSDVFSKETITFYVNAWTILDFIITIIH